MSAPPRVSVIIPAHQSEQRIGSTLRRLTRQTFSDIEIVVVNDGSVDGTSRVVRDVMKADPRVRLLEQPNKGMGAARNHGIAEARGEIIGFLDDDDLWLPRKLEKQISRLDATPGAAVVSCFSALVDPHGGLLGWRFGGVTEGDVYREMLEWDMVSGGSVALVRREPLEEAGGYDESLLDRADWDLWIRLARRHQFACVAEPLVGYTRRPGSVSHGYDLMVEDGHDVIAKAARDDHRITAREHRNLVARDLFAAGCLALVDGNLTTAGSFLWRSLRLGPRLVLARPRRWGIFAMLALAGAAAPLYRTAVSRMSRSLLGLEPGDPFDDLEKETASGRAG